MSSQRRVLATPDGPYVVYHRDTAGLPEAHKDPAGPWYFQPADYDGGDVFSHGYPDAEAAENAAFAYAQQALAERQQLEPVAPAPRFVTITDAKTFVENSGVIDWEWGGTASLAGLTDWLWKHHADDDLPRHLVEWWDECLWRYLMSVGETPKDYGLPMHATPGASLNSIQALSVNPARIADGEVSRG